MNITEARKKLKAIIEVLPALKEIEAILKVSEEAESKKKELIESVASLKTQVSDKSDELNTLNGAIEANRLNTKANRDADKKNAIAMVEERSRLKQQFNTEMKDLTKSLEDNHASTEKRLRLEMLDIKEMRDKEQTRLDLVKTQLRVLKSTLVN
jgi:hypothetical protein